MPRKQWSAYEKLTAADVNANLSDQSVMRFASSAARSTAIPSPTEGMVSWLDDVNALQVYDGSAWVAVIGGTPGNPLGAGDPLNVGSLYLTRTNYATGTWHQITASMPVDALVFGVSAPSENGIDTGGDWNEWATGAAGSEVVRFVDGKVGDRGSGEANEVPWGFFVPAGSRVAWRRTRIQGGGVSAIFNNVAIRYVSVASGTQYEAGRTTPVSLPLSTAWTQIDTTPPKTGGVWVTGFMAESFNGNDPVRVRFGTGGAGSEVAVSGYMHSAGIRTFQAFGGSNAPATNTQPFWWPPGTRLSVQSESTPTSTGQCAVIWRETLA